MHYWYDKIRDQHQCGDAVTRPDKKGVAAHIEKFSHILILF